MKNCCIALQHKSPRQCTVFYFHRKFVERLFRFFVVLYSNLLTQQYVNKTPLPRRESDLTMRMSRYM